jgi:hypothetical protein
MNWSLFTFHLSLFFVIPALVVAGIVILLCLSGSRRDRSFGWASLMLIIGITLTHLTWHFTWLQLLKYSGMSIGIGLLYTVFKWVHGVSIYHGRVITALKNVVYPAAIEVDTNDLDIGSRYTANALNRKDALTKLTPQFSEYKAPALGWTIFWPFFILVDIAPIRVIESIISAFGKPAQYFADKTFEDKDV